MREGDSGQMSFKWDGTKSGKASEILHGGEANRLTEAIGVRAVSTGLDLAALYSSPDTAVNKLCNPE